MKWLYEINGETYRVSGMKNGMLTYTKVVAK